MTKPTPAQIMQKALIELKELGEIGMKPDYDEWLCFHDKVAKVASAALTAAAEVGEPTYDDWVGRAAQMEAERDARITKREYDDALDDMRQATIERCAQVADERGTNEGNKIADRIRALKDKP